jgi:hypothetical protein
MTVIIKKGASPDDLKKINQKINATTTQKGFDAYRYCGVIKLKKDALSIQKRLRDEWN